MSYSWEFIPESLIFVSAQHLNNSVNKYLRHEVSPRMSVCPLKPGCDLSSMTLTAEANSPPLLQRLGLFRTWPYTEYPSPRLAPAKSVCLSPVKAHSRMAWLGAYSAGNGVPLRARVRGYKAAPAQVISVSVLPPRI